MGLMIFGQLVDLWVVVVILICIIVLLVFVIQRIVRAHRQQATTGREELIGKTATVETPLNPRGTVLFRGEHWTAISETGRVEPGEEVIINRVVNLKLYVNKNEGGK